MDDLNYNCYDRPTTEAKFTKTDRTKWQLDGCNKVDLYCMGGQEWALQHCTVLAEATSTKGGTDFLNFRLSVTKFNVRCESGTQNNSALPCERK